MIKSDVCSILWFIRWMNSFLLKWNRSNTCSVKSASFLMAHCGLLIECRTGSSWNVGPCHRRGNEDSLKYFHRTIVPTAGRILTWLIKNNNEKRSAAWSKKNGVKVLTTRETTHSHTQEKQASKIQTPTHHRKAQTTSTNTRNTHYSVRGFSCAQTFPSHFF